MIRKNQRSNSWQKNHLIAAILIVMTAMMKLPCQWYGNIEEERCTENIFHFSAHLLFKIF